jgi:hypothetical protein
MAIAGIREKNMKAHISMRSAVKLAAAVALGGAILALASCFYMPGISSGKARAGIVLPRYLIANPVSLALIVGGPGMEPMFSSYTTIPSSISIEVPAGLARTFTVLLSGLSATLQGVATVDLQPGETKDITVNPTVAGTQIVVPDYLNNQLVQIADMTGTGWTVASVTSPYDVDFDDQGRIYVACPNSAGAPSIFRLNDITDTSPVALTGVSSTTIQSIAMDRPRGLLYYTDGYTLWRMQVTPTLGTEETVDLGMISLGVESSVYMYDVTGIDVDSDGFLYIANTSSSTPGSTILKINPNPASSPTLVTTSSFAFNGPWDVMVKGDYVYVSDPNNTTNTGQVVRLSKNLDSAVSFSGPASDPFLGPKRFVATLNAPITLIDESYSNGTDRLVSFKDITGAGWATPYGSTGNADTPGYFRFYSNGT